MEKLNFYASLVNQLVMSVMITQLGVERSQHVNLKNVMKTLDPILKIWILGCRRNVMKIVQMPMSNGSFRIGLTL